MPLGDQRLTAALHVPPRRTNDLPAIMFPRRSRHKEEIAVYVDCATSPAAHGRSGGASAIPPRRKRREMLRIEVSRSRGLVTTLQVHAVHQIAAAEPTLEIFKQQPLLPFPKAVADGADVRGDEDVVQPP